MGRPHASEADDPERRSARRRCDRRWLAARCLDGAGRSAPIWNCTKVFGGEKLIEGGEGLEAWCCRAEAAAAVAGGGQDAALKAEDGAGAQVGEHDALEAEGDVAGAVAASDDSGLDY